MRSKVRLLRDACRAFWQQLTVRPQSEQELAQDAMRYWNEGDRAGIDLRDYSHWQGAGPWADRENWLALGRVHFEMYERLCAHAGVQRPLRRAVEWGSGGGANAVHFAREFAQFCGVEIAQASLGECARVLGEAGYDGFQPVLIDASRPEDALQAVAEPFDFFLSTYVFELIPGRAYGERVARVAFDMLRPGGLALIQIRYDDGTSRSSQKVHDYFGQSDRFTSYPLDDFWRRMERIGFEVLYVQLVPDRKPGFSGDRYAYVAMRRPVTR